MPINAFLPKSDRVGQSGEVWKNKALGANGPSRCMGRQRVDPRNFRVQSAVAPMQVWRGALKRYN